MSAAATPASAAGPRSRGVWGSGQAYQPYMGRWSRRIAAGFLDMLAVGKQARWLDLGCGTGALTEAVLEQAQPLQVVGLDPSPGFLAFAAERITDARVRWQEGDGTALPFPDGDYDAAVSGLVLNFLARADLVVAEMVRVTRPGGTVAAYVWDYGEGMQILRHFWDAAIALDAGAAALDEANRSATWRPAALRTLFRAAGLRDVVVSQVEVPAVFASFDEYWQPFLGGQGTVGSYAVSLSEPARRRLASALARRLPSGPDGTVPLTVRAWTVHGLTPPRSRP
jgi:SAM-dependent methyltransferase